MQLTRLALMFFVLAALCVLPVGAGTYTLTDGTSVTGEPIAYAETGLILRTTAGIAPRIEWTRFTQEALKQLAEEARRPADRQFVDPFIEDYQRERERRQEIIVQEPESRPVRPEGSKGLFAMFGSGLGVLLILLGYGANVFAGYELARYRGQPIGMGIGLGLIPVLGPLAFAFIPTKIHARPVEEEDEGLQEPSPEEVAAHAAAVAAAAETGAAPPPPPPAPVFKKKGEAPTITLSSGAANVGLAGTAGASVAGSSPAVDSEVAATGSETQVFEKGKFIFNRRFFETKMPGFFRAVPRDEDKDLVVLIKSLRGDFTGKRITAIDQSQLTLQIFKGDVTADEVIPFMEIQEVRIQHKDT